MPEKAVFAHYVLGCCNFHTLDVWKEQISLAQDAHIDGFVLNLSTRDGLTETQLSYAFQAANEKKFKCLFSFDCAADSNPDEGMIVRLINTYGRNGAYYLVGGKPLVSTFEGGALAALWKRVKDKCPNMCFVPDWSGTGFDLLKNNTLLDGHFTWSAWPKGPNAMTTVEDKLTRDAIGKKLYMMAVSPWFYTNCHGQGFSKNWTWRGDGLWYERWQQAITLQPDFVEIISWNDFGESHYIGPVPEGRRGDEIVQTAKWYVEKHPHDAWRSLLPYFIDEYKGKPVQVNREHVVFWYRLTSSKTGDARGTLSSPDRNAAQVDVRAIQSDIICVAVVLSKPADVRVKIGNNAISEKDKFTATRYGVTYKAIDIAGRLGEVTVEAVRDGKVIFSKTGDRIVDGNGRNTEFNPCVFGS